MYASYDIDTSLARYSVRRGRALAHTDTLVPTHVGITPDTRVHVEIRTARVNAVGSRDFKGRRRTKRGTHKTLCPTTAFEHENPSRRITH